MDRKRLSLRDRHAIKEGVADINDSKVFRAKAGKAIKEGLLRLKHEVRDELGIGEADADEAIKKRNWKMAIWITVDKTRIEKLPDKVGDILVELYKKECSGETHERFEQWIIYAKEVFDGALEIYTENGMIENEFADLMMKAIDNAKEKITEMEFRNKKIAR